MKKLLFIYNPYSGKGQIKNHIMDILDTFTKNSYTVVAHPTQSQGDAYNMIKKYSNKYDFIVCSGGDGTLNETIAGIMDAKTKVPIGYIPAGTMNDFSTNLFIPKNMSDAASIIATGKPVLVDIGGFNKRYFTYVAAFGIFTSVSYATDQQLKNNFGAMAYFIEAIKTAPSTKSYNITVKCGDNEVRDTFIYGMVANSMSVAGIKDLAGTDVSISDGLFEGIFVKTPKNIVELQHILNALIKHDFESPYLYYFKGSDFQFHADEEVPWTIDGEFGGSVKDVDLTVHHNALSVITGDKND